MINRRLNISALLAATCALMLPRVALAQGAPGPGAAPGAPGAPAPGAPPAGAAPPGDAPKGPEVPPGDKPPELDAKPDAVPAAEASPTAAPTPAAAAEVKAAPVAPAPATGSDAMPKAGYVPGYRSYVGVGLTPYVPRTGSLPGGFTPSFGAPAPSDDWSFNFTGFMSASVRASFNSRDNPAPGQSSLVLHAAPTTIDSYQSFNDTGATPGNWVGMLFSYGNRYVTATVSFDTYNPTRGTNYRSIGSQYFINDTFLSFRAPRLDRLQLAWNVGFFRQNYGRLGEYGGGLYNPPLIGTTEGAGESLTAEYDLTDTLTLIVEDGFSGSPRTGKPPDGVVNSAASNFSDSSLPPAFTHHAHVGILRKGDTKIQVMAHALSNFTLSDQVPAEALDNPDTRQWDERKPRDGSIHVFGLEGRAINQSYGYLALGAAYIKANNAYRVRGMTTYAQDGTRLTQDWLGETTGGTGSIWVAAVNYRFSIGSILRAPVPFWSDAPDVQGEASFQVAGTQSDDKVFDGRLKQKVGADLLYTFIPWMGVGVRADRIAPNSKDAEETFYALATRLQFRSNWTSHETITLKYVKWFYGDRTHGDGWDARPREQLDEHMLGLGFGMWW